MRRKLLSPSLFGALALLSLTPGCFLAGATSHAPADAAPTMDAGPTPDAGLARVDAGPGVDAGLGVDAGRRPDTGPGDDAGRDAGPVPCVPSADPTEICNGIDDDCNPDTGDGSGDPLYGEDCDSPGDMDECAGIWVCNAGALACTDDPLVNVLEVCGGGDEDCDGEVDEAGAADALTFYADTDGDGYGDAAGTAATTVACEAPDGYVADATDCDDTTNTRSPGESEACDGIDEDCDGRIDEGACGDCVSGVYMGRPYLYCSRLRSWTEADSDCRGYGGGGAAYELARIDDHPEHDFVRALAGGARAWIGLNDRGNSNEGNWQWTFGASGAPFRLWGGDEPNNSGSWPGEDCVEINAYANGLWNDADCDDDKPYLCEWAE